MSYHLIQDDRIVGTIDSPDAFPGWTIATYEGAMRIADLYWDGEEIQEKPPQPSPNHYWSDGDRAWIEPEPIDAIESPLEPDWNGLVNWLRGSLYFERVYGASKLTAGANTAATLLLMTINQSRNLQDLAFVLPDLLGEIEAIAAQGYIPAFTSEEKQALADKLIDLNFPDSVVAPLANV